MAQAGGTEVAKIDEALEKLYALLGGGASGHARRRRPRLALAYVDVLPCKRTRNAAAWLTLLLFAANACHRAGPPSVDVAADADDGAGEGEEPPLIVSSASAKGPTSFLAKVDAELRTMKRSTYAHKTSVDEAAGVFDYDGSGFVDYALSRSAPRAFSALQASTPRRPRATEIVAFVEHVPVTAPDSPWSVGSHSA
jgi:hypothetical protein